MNHESKESLITTRLIQRERGEKAKTLHSNFLNEGYNPFKLDQEFGDDFNTEGIMIIINPDTFNNGFYYNPKLKYNR